MSLPITITMIKRDGKLINNSALDKIRMDTLLEQMKEGEEVEVTYELMHAGGTHAQLSRLHVSIRKLAEETGASFEDIKFEVKRKAGLIVGEKVKSFGKCTKDELSKAIQVAIEIGDLLSINLH